VFSPCYLLLKKSSKSIIPHGNCPFLRNSLPVLLANIPVSGILTARVPSTQAAAPFGPVKSAEAKAWVVNLAWRKAKELGYPHELWTTRLLARHAREHGPAEEHACLGKLAQGTLCNILNEQEIKPHKVRYYLERRDPEFKAKMAEAKAD
jgi:hypothetical protein